MSKKLTRVGVYGAPTQVKCQLKVLILAHVKRTF